MSIEKLQIRKFRTHERLNIDFSPLVNSIIGQNFAGKSTIIRAIRWVARNKPSGDSIINWDADRAAVRLTIDKNKVTRTKGKGVNTYRLNKKKPYKAFKNKVPKDIEKIINLSDINFQGQHEAPFWFCETAGEVSRQLNAIVNLEVMDHTLSNIDSTLHKTKLTIKIIEERLDKAEAQQNSLAYVEQMDEDLQRVENLQKQHQEKAAKYALLQDILKLALQHTFKRKSSLEMVSGSKLALSKGLKHQEITVQLENLLKSVELGEHLQKIIKAKPPSLNRLEELKKKIKRLINSFINLGALIEKLKINKEMECQAKRDLKKYKKELEQIAGERCPLCGTVRKK